MVDSLMFMSMQAKQSSTHIIHKHTHRFSVRLSIFKATAPQVCCNCTVNETETSKRRKRVLCLDV